MHGLDQDSDTLMPLYEITPNDIRLNTGQASYARGRHYFEQGRGRNVYSQAIMITTKEKESAKLDLLMSLLPEMVEEGRRILLFSQFTKMLAIIEGRLVEAGIAYSKLTGQTRKREAAIDHFRSGAAPVFLISLKADGVYAQGQDAMQGIIDTDTLQALFAPL